MKLDSVGIWNSKDTASTSNTLNLILEHQHTVVVLQADSPITTFTVNSNSEGYFVWLFNFTSHSVSYGHQGGSTAARTGSLLYKSDGSDFYHPSSWNKFDFQLSSIVYPQPSGSITVTPSSLSFSANPVFVAGATNLTVVSSRNWSATFTSGILFPSQGSAGTTKVLFNPGANNNASQRSGILTFTCDTASDTVTWTQAGKPDLTTLTINPTSLTLSALGVAMTNNVTVTCSGSWTASTTNSWINLSKTSGIGNGTLTVSADKHTGTSSRSGTVTFKSGSQTRTLNVTQQGAVTKKYYLTVSYNGSAPSSINATAYIDGTMRPSVAYVEQNPIQICEITASDAGKSYTVRVSSTNIGVTCVPNQFTGTLPATISSDYNVGTFLIQYT